MKIYLSYSQTPELMGLENPAERNSVHAKSWSQLRAQHPRFWARSLVLIVVIATVGAFVGHLVGSMLGTLTPPQWITVFASIGGGFGALFHIHLIAEQLRPIYKKEIEERKPKNAEQGEGADTEPAG